MVKNAKKRVKTKNGKRSVGRAKVQAKRKAKAQAKAVKRVGKGKRKRQMPGAGVQTLPTPSVTHEAVTTELRIASEVNAAVGGLPVEAIAEPPATSSGLSPDEEKAQLNAMDEADAEIDAATEALLGADPDDIGSPGNDYR